MFNRKFSFALLLVFIVACSPEGIKIYKVDYNGNYPVGAFKALIGNNTIFTNDPNILEVRVKNKPDFFCYGINKEVLCRFNIDIKISEDVAKKFVEVTQNLKEMDSRSGKNMTILSQRLNYYLNDKKLEEEDIMIASELKGELVYEVAIPILGKGKTQEEAKEAATKKSDKIIKILIDKK